MEETPDGRGNWSATTGGIVGRAAELALISDFLDKVATAGSVLLISGDAGVGKTRLLEQAAERAACRGCIVARSSGSEFESDAGFMALNQLSYPLMPYVPELPAASREALEVALGFKDGGPPQQQVVAAAMLDLLRQASRAAPVLLVIDDLPWTDRLSTEVLSYVARHVPGSRIGLLAASRSGDDSYFDRSGLPEHTLLPLAPQAARQLLASRFPLLAAEQRARVLAMAQGNPLALLELPAALRTPAPGAFAEFPPEALPLPRRLKQLFSARVSQLPGAVRQLLLAAALDGSGDSRVPTAGTSPPGAGAVFLATQAGLLHAEASGRLAFTHPLVRASVVELSSPQERCQAHRDLAELFRCQPDRRVRHLAAAVHEPDEQVAVLLDQAAERMTARGDSRGALGALIRAAELSVDPLARGRRLAQASYTGVAMGGDRQRAAELLTEALRQDDDVRHSLEVAVASAYLLVSGPGDIDTAYRLMSTAVTAMTPEQPGLEAGLYGMMTVCCLGGRAEQWEPFHEAVRRVGSRLPDTLLACSEMFADPLNASDQVLARLPAIIARLDGEDDPMEVNRVGFAVGYADRVDECRGALERVADGSAEAAAQVILARNVLIWHSFLAGRWQEAASFAEVSLGECREHSYDLLAWPARCIQAMLAAVTGDHASAQAITDEVLAWAGPRLVWQYQRDALLAGSLAGIARGDFEYAYRCVTRIAQPAPLPSHVPQVLYVTLNLVESCLRTGRKAEAQAHVAAMQAARAGRISSRLQLVVTGCAALLADDLTQASELFTQALAVPDASRWPFQLARLRLLYGERLRRAGLSRESREQLSLALAEFQRLGAVPWAERAQGELQATGQVRLRGNQATARLTPQERRVATLAAGGLRNREIAEQLSLSERTVATHLLRAFPKLGVTSRAGLRDALARLPELPPDSCQQEGDRGAAGRTLLIPG